MGSHGVGYRVVVDAGWRSGLVIGWGSGAVGASQGGV